MDRIHQMIEAFRQKDYASFDEFYGLTKKQVFFAIASIIKDQDLVEDLMQDTYIRFLEKIDQYQSNQNPYAYLSTIGRNLAINLYNKRKRTVYNDEIFEQIPSDDETSDEMDIHAMLSHLDLDERQVVTLHIVNNLKFREIAKIMDKPLGTVQWLYHKALRVLKEKYGYFK